MYFPYLFNMGDEQMDIAKLTSKGQITIPQDIRKKLKLERGDKIAFIEIGGRYTMINANDIENGDFYINPEEQTPLQKE